MSHSRQRSALAHRTLKAAYAGLRAIDLPLRAAWRLGLLGITVQLEVRGRRSGRQRWALVGLLTADGRSYVGHPNGPVDWTRNLEAAGEAVIEFRSRDRVRVRAQRLADGAERDAVIIATAAQQPFPANLAYRAVRGHALAVGAYFRLEPMGDQPRGGFTAAAGDPAG